MGVIADRMNFTRAHLVETDLRRASLRDAIFDNAFFDGARVFGADLRGARQIETAFADTLTSAIKSAKYSKAMLQSVGFSISPAFEPLAPACSRARVLACRSA